MGKENSVASPEFILKPADIFQSTETHGLNDYGMACQAIVVRQQAILEAKAEKWSPHIIESLGKEIVSLQMEHNIPQDALSTLKTKFDDAAKQQYDAIVQAVTPRVEPTVQKPRIQPRALVKA